MPVTLAILLGGKGSRMGRPKHSLRTQDGLTLLEHQIRSLSSAFQETLLLSGSLEVSGLDSVPDPSPWQGEGPLAGLLAALQTATTEWIALAAIDQVCLGPDLYRHALQVAQEKSEALVYLDSQGRRQWLCGLYLVSLKSRVREQLTLGTRAMWRFGETVAVQDLALPAHLSEQIFTNVNTPEQAEIWGLKLT